MEATAIIGIVVLLALGLLRFVRRFAEEHERVKCLEELLDRQHEASRMRRSA